MADCIYELKSGVGIALKDIMQTPSEFVGRLQGPANRVRKEGRLRLGGEPLTTSSLSQRRRSDDADGGRLQLRPTDLRE